MKGIKMNREIKIANKIIGKEMSDWEEAVHMVYRWFDNFADDIKDGNFDGMNDVIRKVQELDREKGNLDDEILIREVERVIEEMRHLMSDVEVESRTWEDEVRKHQGKCNRMSQKATELALKVKGIGSK
jgi:hypothetical protein